MNFLKLLFGLITFSGTGQPSVTFVNYGDTYRAKANEIQNAVNNRLNIFQNTLNSHVNQRISDLNGAISNFKSADTIIANAISQYESPIGNESSGFIGSFVGGINGDVSAVSASLSAALSGKQCGDTQCDYPPTQATTNYVNGLSSWYSSTVQNIISAAYASMSNILTANRKVFYDRVGVVSSDSFSSRLAFFVSTYKSSVNVHVTTATNSINSSYTTYSNRVKALSPDDPQIDSKVQRIITDFEASLQPVLDTFNSSATGESSVFDGSVRAVKYSGNGADAKLTSAYADINSHLTSSVSSVTSVYTEVATKFNNDVSVFSTSTFNTKLSFLTNNASSEVNSLLASDRSELLSSFNKSSQAIKSVKQMVSELLTTMPPTSYIDSSTARDFARSARNSAMDLMNSVIASRTVEFNNAVKSLDASQVSKLTSISDKYNTDLQGAYVTGASQDTADTYIDNFSELINSGRNSFSESITDNTNSLTDVIYATRDEITKYIDKVLAAYPIIRLTGEADLPSNISTTGPTRLSFEVKNVGGSTWGGWFGLNAVDEGGNKYFHNYKPLSLTKISAGATQKIVIEVPFNTYLAGKTPRSLNITLVSNTSIDGVST